MYETADNENRAVTLPREALVRFEELADAIDARSQIVWGEHCTECGYPACYATCEFYQPRRDGNCRRFAGGVTRLREGASSLSAIRFQRWAKLEGVGPVGLIDFASAARHEALDQFVSGAINTLGGFRGAYRQAAKRWNRLKLRRSAGNLASDIDGFVIEAWNPEKSPCDFVFGILPVGAGETSCFQSRVTLEHGYNRIVVPRAAMAAVVNLDSEYLIRLESFDENVDKEIVFGLLDFVRFKPRAQVQSYPLAAKGESGAASSNERGARSVKCVVWDLDNTVWRGTLAEDGHEGVVLDSVAVETIKELDRRGILQSVASKNDHATAMEALGVFGLADYFLFPQINWDPKSDSIRRIATSLDIGLDTFVFIDDQAFERGEVAHALPMISVLEETAIPDVLADSRFSAPVTAESKNRRQMYRVEERRRLAFDASGTDYLGFLRGCDIQLRIDVLSQATLERAYELAQRTNQLNVSGQRYARADLAALLDPRASETAIVFSCRDKFGDYGVIGLCVIDRREPVVRSFMMSCRVQRKHVEHAFFSWLLADLRTRGPDPFLRIDFRKTAKNGAAAKMLEALGFEYQAADDVTGTYVRRTDAIIAGDDVVRVYDETHAMLATG